MCNAVIKVSAITGPNNDHGDGRTVYNAIQAALTASQNSVLIDFTGLDFITPSFLNTSFRVLGKQHDYDFLKTRLRIVGGNKLIYSMIRAALTGG